MYYHFGISEMASRGKARHELNVRSAGVGFADGGRGSGFAPFSGWPLWAAARFWSCFCFCCFFRCLYSNSCQSPFIFNRLWTAWVSMTMPAPKNPTYFAGGTAAGSSLVKYSNSNASAAVGRFLGSIDNMASKSSNAPGDNKLDT